ncbi:MAG: hypothetical protein SXV54_09770 [Chloroflexota bacterium]|nr:hypothetical protein [Chloroflexota bacterium]
MPPTTRRCPASAGRATVVDGRTSAAYELGEVESLPSEQAAGSPSSQGLLSAPQEMGVVPLWCKHCDWGGLS